MRVLLLNNVPAPYFTPLFEKLANYSGWSLTVCYSSDWNASVGWSQTHDKQINLQKIVILDRNYPGLHSLLGSSVVAALELWKLVKRQRPDYLICYGYTLKPQIILLFWAMVSDTPFALIGDANYFTDSATGLKKWFKNSWLQRLTRKASALVAIGAANRMFWEKYGAKPEQLFEARFAVDNDFYTQAVRVRKHDAIELLHQLGLDGKIIFLFVGRLVKRKNVDLIIRSMVELNDNRMAVVIAGSGDEFDTLKALASDNPGIIFAGNVSPSDLPLYYALADVLILPASREPWGLVVNEAMACGLAIIVHEHCGAAIDLVDRDNGIKLESFSVDELAKAMKLLTNNEALLRKMQINSRKKIKNWSIDSAASGIIRAVEATYSKR